MIDVRGLTRRFGNTLALDDVTFRLEQGEVVGFLGPNGAGKTTTMRILTGFLPATRGTVTIAGFDVLRDSLEIRRRIGYLAESVPLYREHRVSEMLVFQGRLHGMARRDIQRRSAEVLERVGLTDRARVPVGSLSRGQRQRAGLAVALLPRPEVLILDEPTSGLDPLQRIEVRRLVRELSAEHTVLISSHILAEIEAVCPRVVILARGRVVADGTREALAESHGGRSFVRVEVAAPDMAQVLRLVAKLPGVVHVHDEGRLGMHTALRVEGEGDLREDIGALAAARGWALRELSWQRPSLERLFAKVALGDADLDDRDFQGGPGVKAAPARAAAPAEGPAAVGGLIDLDKTFGPKTTAAAVAAEPVAKPTPAPTPAPAPPAQKPPAAGPMRTLNPFEGFGAPPPKPAPKEPPPKPAPTEPPTPQVAPPTPPPTPPAMRTLNPFEGFGQKPKGEQDPR